MMSQRSQETSWKEKTTKEKLDLVFIVVAIIGFSLGAIVNYRLLNGKK